MYSDSLMAAATELLSRCRVHKHMLSTAESCTGGLIIGLLTEIAGSSDVVERGFVTYSNAAKQELLGVETALLERYGAVSAQVACAMAEGAVLRSGADMALAVTGIAGPGGATQAKPVGRVYIAVAGKNFVTHMQQHDFNGNRQEIRLAAVAAALALALKLV